MDLVTYVKDYALNSEPRHSPPPLHPPNFDIT